MSGYVVANWKSHKTLAEAEKWLEIFLGLYRPDSRVEVIIAPSFVLAAPLARMLRERDAAHLALAVQDLSPFPLGAYTGAVAAEMVQGLVGYALVGHSERRRYFHETNQEIANKVSEALAVGIRPILCLDRPYARAQLAAVNEADANGLIIGYGPVEAIGIDTAQPPEKAGQAVAEIEAIVPGRPILYGGSITAENCDVYLELAGVAGLMVGAASLDPEGFARICQAVAGREG